ncbi:hypothetical protein BKA56DRAFT_598219 [Ilyonectria sp. MPI-CAGE-AT-0026]|nr:hypothetical protein BKA56DRAFT_598219 [Ilyonectria sp. MPI-CAGE-AT-0026]
MPQDVDQPTWFKLHDFTTTAADLPLGTVLRDWNDPSTAIFVPGDAEDPSITWPTESPVLTEEKHEWHDTNDSSSAVNILTKFIKTATFKTDIERQRHGNLNYGTVDLKIKKFQGVRPFDSKAAKAIVSQNEVHNYTNSSSFGYKDVYVVTALRLADKSFDVGKESGSADRTEVSGSVKLPKVPVNVTPSYNANNSNTVDHSYSTAQGDAVGEGVVYAYQMHVIREARDTTTTWLFSHKKGFMTGEDAPKDLECVAVTKEMEGLDSHLFENVGNGEYLYVG